MDNAFGRHTPFVVALLGCGAVACATDPVRQHLKQGRYTDAVELCQSESRTNGACEEASWRAIDARLANLERLRSDGEPVTALVSLAELDQILRLTEREPLPSGSQRARKVADELDRAQATLGSDAKALVDRPLESEVYWHDRAAVLQRPPLRATRVAGQTATRTAGRNACARLRTEVSAEAPYWAALVARYCAHFGVQDHETRAGAARFELKLDVKDLTPSQEGLLRQAFARAFGQSHWGAALEPAVVKGTVSGTYRHTQTDQVVVLHGSYQKNQIAYPVIPTAGHLMVVPQTVDFPYQARDRFGRYEADLVVRVVLPGQAAPLVLGLRKAESLHGRDHDVTFEPAGIHPVHQTVPSADAWLSMELGTLGSSVRRSLDDAWGQAFCKGPSFTRDEAARCFLTGQSSEAVNATLGKAIGDHPRAMNRLAKPAD